MGLFRRKPPEGPNDATLTFMSEADAADFRTLVRTVFAEAGREVTVYADHVADDADGQFGLWNLAAMVAPRPRKEWRRIVTDHVRRVASPGRDLDDLDHGEFREALYLRLVEVSSLPQPDLYPHALPVSEDLVALLSVDLPESVATPPERDLHQRGPLDELMKAGRTNLRRLLESDELESDVVRPEQGGSFRVVMGDSFFTASLALLLGDTAWRFGTEVDGGRGVLVAVPNRHLLGYRVVDGPDAALGLNHLFGLAIKSYGESPGPLSPHVYWVRGEQWTQVTRFDEEGRPCVDLSEELAKALALDE